MDVITNSAATQLISNNKSYYYATAQMLKHLRVSQDKGPPLGGPLILRYARTRAKKSLL